MRSTFLLLVLATGCSCGTAPATSGDEVTPYPERSPATGPAIICAPALVCGCDRGCVRFETAPAVNGAPQFREVGGDPAVLHRRTRAGWMATVQPEECGESCPEPQTAPPYACALEGERCAPGP